MERYICIHGHFYQPPRENPWLEAVEIQESAHPYHDWNARITAECYAPNAKARILDGQGRIVQMVNNYARMSFNFGPTLLAWMERNAPKVYEAVLEADVNSRKRFSGHGSALSQVYNHMILPLATHRDKVTQVRWGIQDFKYRFGRAPEGMWLSETAVDVETLDILAEEGILFTILAPHQAVRVRRLGDKTWQDVSGGKIDPSMAYRVKFSSGRTLALFFYDGPISRAVAFERLLSSGESFAQRLLSGLSDKRTWPQMVHIATDGESYGHHHRFGDMALAYALNAIEAKNPARLTNYGEYLEKHPPTQEVEILENSSWSCAHGVDRWQKHCGCSMGSHPGWKQEWRKPLRDALDWLRESIAAPYEEKGKRYLKDPWEARNHYIEVFLDRSPENTERYLAGWAARELREAEKCTVLKLLEMQRHAMLMYTSCGWFFDEISGIETIQVMQYAGRALRLAQDVFGLEIESSFVERLAQAKSNVPEEKDGGHIYEKFVKPAVADLKKAAANYAMSSLFKTYPPRSSIYCYTAEQEDYHLLDAGKAHLVLGKAQFTSEITRESALLGFGLIHLGDHSMNCGVRYFEKEGSYQKMLREVSEAFSGGDFPQAIRLLDRYFGKSIYSLKSLFRDEQKEIWGLILASTLAEAEAIYRQLYENHAPMIRFLKDSGGTLPKALQTAAEFVVNTGLHRAFEQGDIHVEHVKKTLDFARLAGINLETDSLEYVLRRNLERLAERFSDAPLELDIPERLRATLDLAVSLPFHVNLWTVQNTCYDMLQHTYPDVRRRAEQGEQRAMECVAHFTALCEKLSVRMVLTP